MSEIPLPEPLVLTFAEVCDRGKVREENQDNVRHASIALGELMLVADGMGGYRGGATASNIAAETFLAYLASLPADYPPEQAIREAAALANGNIVGAASAPGSAYRRMGSTVVLALITQNATGTGAWIGHIGDSRAYLARAGQLTRITNDHSTVQALLNRNLITPEEARNHPDASELTRSLGHQPEVEIDIDTVRLQDGDCLLLCSDGLWGFVQEQAIEAVAANSELRIETAAQSLLDLALAAGGHDNIGIEMVRVAKAPVAFKPPRRTRFVTILGACLLALAVLAALAWFALKSHWLHGR
jgi:serine/threonine protein phosphatase PrpC